MIDFTLTDEQKALQSMAREFAQKEMRPNAAKYDKGEEFPQEIMQKAFEAGFITSNIPEQYGGGGLSDFELALISEELAAGCAGMFTTMMASSLAFTPILLFGTDEQRQKFLTPFSKKMSLAAFCLTEREAGSDAGAQKSRAVKVGNEYIINGSKCFITNGGVASLYIVFATTDPDKGARGIRNFCLYINR
jgi:acyl-CoA dehydrogenase